MNTCAFCGATMTETDKLDECSHPEGQGGATGTLGVRTMNYYKSLPRRNTTKTLLTCMICNVQVLGLKALHNHFVQSHSTAASH